MTSIVAAHRPIPRFYRTVSHFVFVVSHLMVLGPVHKSIVDHAIILLSLTLLRPLFFLSPCVRCSESDSMDLLPFTVFDWTLSYTPSRLFNRLPSLPCARGGICFPPPVRPPYTPLWRGDSSELSRGPSQGVNTLIPVFERTDPPLTSFFFKFPLPAFRTLNQTSVTPDFVDVDLGLGEVGLCVL